MYCPAHHSSSSLLPSPSASVSLLSPFLTVSSLPTPASRRVQRLPHREDEGYFTNCMFANCQTQSKGGALVEMGGSLIVDSCSFDNCSASKGGPYGGAIYIFAGYILFVKNKCTFSSCWTGSQVGALYADRVRKCFFIHNSEIHTCTSCSYGNEGGLFVTNCPSQKVTSTCPSYEDHITQGVLSGLTLKDFRVGNSAGGLYLL